MSTSFVHIGDFHAAPGPRNADRYRALEQILAEGSCLPDLGAWLWPGDLNHARMAIEDRNRLAETLMDMGRIAPVVLCYGNHDLPGDLEVFAHLRSRHRIYVVDRPQVLRLELATGRMASVFVLPYPSKAGLVASGVTPNQVVETGADCFEPIFLHSAAQLAVAREAGDLTLMIGHINVAGAVLSNGQPNVGHELQLNPRHLDRLGPIPKLLNHIHKPQEIAGAIYAGSVCRLDYGEVEEKRYLVVTCEAGVYDIASQPIAIAPMFHIDGRLSRDGFTWELAGDQSMPHDGAAIDWSGADLRVRVTYRASEKPALAFERVATEFAGALRLKIETIAEPDRELRAPEVAAAKTLPEKLAAYRKEPTLPASLEQKLVQLISLNQEQLLAFVATTLHVIEQTEDATVAA